jgi:hypothetical protein
MSSANRTSAEDELSRLFTLSLDMLCIAVSTATSSASIRHRRMFSATPSPSSCRGRTSMASRIDCAETNLRPAATRTPRSAGRDAAPRIADGDGESELGLHADLRSRSEVEWCRAGVARTGGSRIIRTPFRAPNCNAYAERFVRSIQRGVFQWRDLNREATSAAHDCRLRGPLPRRAEPSRHRERVDTAAHAIGWIRTCSPTATDRRAAEPLLPCRVGIQTIRLSCRTLRASATALVVAPRRQLPVQEAVASRSKARARPSRRRTTHARPP